MPGVLGNPPSPRAAVFWNGAAWQWALVDAAGHLMVDLAASTVPGGIATAANQIGIAATLGVIDNLVDALGGPGDVRLQVRGENQLFSYKGNLVDRVEELNASAPDHYMAGASPPAGEVWVVTTATAFDLTSGCTEARVYVTIDGVGVKMADAVPAVAGQAACWSGHVFLEPGDHVDAAFIGCTAGDDVYLEVSGYKMTLEV